MKYKMEEKYIRRRAIAEFLLGEIVVMAYVFVYLFGIIYC